MSLGALVRQSSERYWLHSNAEAVEFLVQDTMQTAKQEVIQPCGLANITYGAARSCTGRQMGALFRALARAVVEQLEQRMWDFDSKTFANTAWAFATVGHKDERLLSTLAAAAE